MALNAINIETMSRLKYHLILSILFRKMVNMNQTVIWTEVLLFFRNLRKKNIPQLSKKTLELMYMTIK